ncbi:hypothetical protein [Shinella pollutisoli]|uniref:Transposase n=1 Tax=Shinella pollutisoli TaxID=2250594 RepID=A0ABV7DDN8_9HYPH|nr:hypothetical protein [Shinella pollutisoli]
MTAPKKDSRERIDLAVRYNPLGIRAVIAAAMLVKVRRLPGK